MRTRLASVALFAAGILLAPDARALAVNFGDAPVPEGPAFTLTVDGVSATATRQNETLAAQVQRTNKGIGVAAGQNEIQNGEDLFLDFGTTIELERFVLWFDGTGASDPFSVEIGDGIAFGAVSLASEDGPLTSLPPGNEPSGAGRWFRYVVDGTPTGSVLKIGGTDPSSDFRVKRVQYSIVPEPATALLVGLGLALLGRAAPRRA